MPRLCLKKRLPSTLLYTINPKYIVGYRESGHIDRKSVPRDRSDRSDRSLLIEHIINPTNITNLIKEVVDKGGDQSKIISTLATLSADTLKKAIKENDNIFYSKLALKEQSEKKGKLVDIPRNIVDNFRKKAHFGYQQVINKRKDKFARETKTKDFLSELNKKK